MDNILIRYSVIAGALILFVFVIPLTVLRGCTEGTSSAVVRSRLAQGIADSAPLRLALRSHYADTGEFPEDLEELGLTQAMFRNPGNRTVIRLEEEGSFVISALRKDGTVHSAMYFDPVGFEDGNDSFECFTGDLQDVEQYFPQCRYDRSLASRGE